MDAGLEQRLRRIAQQQLQCYHNAGMVDWLRSGRWQHTAAAPVAEQDVEPVGNEDQHMGLPGQGAKGSGATGEPQSLFNQAETIGTPLPRAERVAALTALENRVCACRRCDELARTRTQTVFGVGNPEARLVFLGEAPGADEDRQGVPFVGRAGKLLTKIIEACTLRREDVYILNILKCRPPSNRNPEPAEAANCQEYLLGQLEIIQPEFICCLGAVAAQNLLQTTVPIGRLRGRFHNFRGIRVMATYHPAYLLRNPRAKRATWEDMQMLMRAMDIEIPPSPRKNS